MKTFKRSETATYLQSYSDDTTPWQPGNLWVGGKQYAPVDDSGTIVAMVLARGLPGLVGGSALVLSTEE